MTRAARRSTNHRRAGQPASSPTAPVPCRTLAFDVGGSSVKAVLLDELGKPLGAVQRVKTPRSRSPTAILRVMERMASGHRFDRLSVGIPGAVSGGVVRTAPNLSAEWEHLNAAELFESRFGRPVRVANDADVQGFGAIAGKGVEIVITLGTGVGSALFVDGHLVPNVEVGRNKLSDAARRKIGLKRWRRRVARFVRRLELMFSFDHLYLGGGNAALLDVRDLLPNVKIVSNVNGLVGGVALWGRPGDEASR